MILTENILLQKSEPSGSSVAGLCCCHSGLFEMSLKVLIGFSGSELNQVDPIIVVLWFGK